MSIFKSDKPVQICRNGRYKTMEEWNQWMDASYGWTFPKTKDNQMKYRVHVLIEMPVIVEAESPDDAVSKALAESADIGGPYFLIRGVTEGNGRKQVGKEMRGQASELFGFYPVGEEKEYQDFLDFCSEAGCIAGNRPLTPRDWIGVERDCSPGGEEGK